MSFKSRLTSLSLCIAASITALSVFTPFVSAADKIIVYSARKENIDKPIFEAFTKQTGIVVESLHDDSKKLLARLNAEGKDTPADVLLVVDSTNLAVATQSNLFNPTKSDVLDKAIPAEFREEQGRWYGLSKRMRPIFYNKDKVKPEQLSTYEDLADPKWKGQLLVRSSSNPYNLSLLSAMIASNGVEKTQGWANGIATNLARPPQGGDTDQIKAIASGEGTVGIANTYYYVRMLTSDLPEEREAAKKVGIFFPNQNALKGQMQGTHMNISGVGVISFSKNSAMATKFIEFLSTEPLQRLYADGIQEYPMNVNVKPSDVLQGFGSFKVDTTPVNTFGKYNEEAVRIADRSGWK